MIFAKCAEQVCAGLTYVTVTVENGEYLFESHYGLAQVGLDRWGLGSESDCHTLELLSSGNPMTTTQTSSMFGISASATAEP